MVRFSAHEIDSETILPADTTSAHLVALHVASAKTKIFRALLSLASASLLMRVAGLLNLFAVTYRFGQGPAMDAYFVAVAVPVLFSELLTNAVEASVIPVYTRIRTQGKEITSRLFSTLLNILIISMGVLVALMLLLRQQIIFLSAPGLVNHPASLQLAVTLTPFIFPVLLCMALNNFMECLLNAEGQFGWPAYSGILVPLTSAAFVLLAGKPYGVIALCLGAMTGQTLHLLVIIVRAHRAKLTYRPIVDIHSPGIRFIALLAWPAFFTALISHASPFVDQIFSSHLSTGSISSINNALKLVSVPVGVIFASVGRAALPYLAGQAAIQDMRAFKETLRLYLWLVVISTLFMSIGMILLAHPIVQLFFQRGAFTAADTSRTATTLIGFAIGLVPMAISFIVSGAFNAMGQTRALMFVTFFSVLANAFFDYIFGLLWQSFGIALATSAVYVCTMLILFFTLHGMLGPLHLLTPPQEIRNTFLHVTQYLAMRRNKLVAWQRYIIRSSSTLLVFLAGAVGSVINAPLTLAIAFGSIATVVFLRYPYALLIAWTLLCVFVGSIIPFFNGNHLLSGLTIPSLLLLFFLPTRIALQRMKALIVLLVLLLWMLFSSGDSPLTPSAFIVSWTTRLDCVAVGVIVILCITTRQRLLRLIDLLFLPAVVLCLYGIYGYMTKQNGVIDTQTNNFRIGSIYGASPSTLSLYLSVIIPLAIYRTLILQGWKRVPGMMLTILLVVTLGLTFTRGALLAVGASIVVMIMFLPSGKLKAGFLSLLGGIGGTVALLASTGIVPLFSRFLNSDVMTLNGRTYLWHALLDHFDPMRLLGYGYGASDELFIRLRIGFRGAVIDNAAHDLFLQTLYDHGIIGMLLLITLFIMLALTLILKARQTTFAHRMITAMALGVFTSIIIQSFLSNDVWNQAISINLWIILALPFARCWAENKNAPGHTYPDDEATRPLPIVEHTGARVK